MTYYDLAVDEYFHQLHGEWANPVEEMEIALVKAEMEFKSPARLYDLLNIYCRVTRLGQSSIDVEFAITRDGQEEILSTAHNVYVVFEPVSGTARPIPDWLREKIKSFENLPE